MIREISRVALVSVLVSVLVLAMTLLASNQARASTFRAMSVEELTWSSAAVVEGTVVRLRSFWNDEHTMIFTETRVEVARVLRGKTEPTITVRTVGGTVDGYTVRADGFPEFVAGERVMLFLTPIGDRYRVTGYRFGHFRLQTGEDGSEVAVPTLDVSPDPRLLGSIESQSLDELRERVVQASVMGARRQQAAPFVLLSPPRTWDHPAVVIVDNRGLASIEDGDHGVSRAVAAINSSCAWNGAGAGVVIAAVAGRVNGFSLGDGIPMINFQDPLNVCTGNCFAATFTGFFSQRSDGTWRIDDADIVFNSGGFDWTSEGEDPAGCGCDGEIYVESRVVHETGHLLGLAHTNVAGATMFPAVLECDDTQATIEADDRAGIVFLYGG